MIPHVNCVSYVTNVDRRIDHRKCESWGIYWLWRFRLPCEKIGKDPSGIVDNSNELTIFCDTEVSKENVSRFLKDRGYAVETKEIEDYFEILAKRNP